MCIQLIKTYTSCPPEHALLTLTHSCELPLFSIIYHRIEAQYIEQQGLCPICEESYGACWRSAGLRARRMSCGAVMEGAGEREGLEGDEVDEDVQQPSVAGSAPGAVEMHDKATQTEELDEEDEEDGDEEGEEANQPPLRPSQKYGKNRRNKYWNQRKKEKKKRADTTTTSTTNLTNPTTDTTTSTTTNPPQQPTKPLSNRAAKKEIREKGKEAKQQQEQQEQQQEQQEQQQDMTSEKGGEGNGEGPAAAAAALRGGENARTRRNRVWRTRDAEKVRVKMEGGGG